MADLRIAWISCDPPDAPGAGTWELVFLDGVLVSRGLAKGTPPGPGPSFLCDGTTWADLCRAAREAPGLLFTYRFHADPEGSLLDTRDAGRAYACLPSFLERYAPDLDLGVPSADCFGFWRLTAWQRDGENLVRWWERPARHGHPPIQHLAGIVECVVPGWGSHRCFSAYTRRDRKLDGYAMAVPLPYAMRRVDGFLARHQRIADERPPAEE